VTRPDLSIVDTHAHLDMGAFDKDREEVIARALNSGVSTIITVGTNLESSKKAMGLAERHPQILAAVGFHPHDTSSVKKADIANLAEIAKHPRVVAIGETGLDFYRNYSPREKQLEVLKWQLDLTDELKLPIIIHCRQAEQDMLALLHVWTSHHKGPQEQGLGVIHCFSGDSSAARQYLDMGFYLSLAAYVGYPGSRSAKDVIKNIPNDRLLVETDCPFLPPQTHRGQRNEPAYLPITVEVLAKIREVPLETVAKETTQNAHHLFRRK
jgi:TatD DNase family protein